MTHRTARRAAAAAVLPLAIAGCMAASSTQGATSAGGAGPASTASREGAEQRVAQLVNQHRASRGCPALVWDDGAARVAAAHSRDMAARRYFSHTSPEGRSPFDRLDAAGIRWSTAAENIAQDPRGADEVVRGWLASPGHRANIENCTLTRHGVGVSGQLWTHVFYTPAPR